MCPMHRVNAVGCKLIPGVHLATQAKAYLRILAETPTLVPRTQPFVKTIIVAKVKTTCTSHNCKSILPRGHKSPINNVVMQDNEVSQMAAGKLKSSTQTTSTSANYADH